MGTNDLLMKIWWNHKYSDDRCRERREAFCNVHDAVAVAACKNEAVIKLCGWVQHGMQPLITVNGGVTQCPIPPYPIIPPAGESVNIYSNAAALPQIQIELEMNRIYSEMVS